MRNVRRLPYREGSKRTYIHTRRRTLINDTYSSRSKCRLYADLRVMTAEELRSVVGHSRVGLAVVRKRPRSLLPAQVPLVSVEFLSISVII